MKLEESTRLSGETLVSFLEEMLLIRRFEEKVEERFRAGDLSGFLHVALGQEAVAVGGGLPGIVGAALAFKMRGQPRVAVAFFGDGATNTGAFHESLNLGQLWTVPAVFVCENNHYAESTPSRDHMPIVDLTRRAEAFGMRSIVVDGQDVEAVHAAATEAVAHARAGNGPVFLLANTYRLTGHYVGDPQVYRPKDEQRDLRATQDPIPRLRELLGVDVDEDSWSALEAKVAATVEASVEFAKNGTDRLPEDALLNVYA